VLALGRNERPRLSPDVFAVAIGPATEQAECLGGERKLERSTSYTDRPA